MQHIKPTCAGIIASLPVATLGCLRPTACPDTDTPQGTRPPTSSGGAHVGERDRYLAAPLAIRTLSIDRFHAMNVFGETDAARKLRQLEAEISGLTGQNLAAQPDLAARPSEACAGLKRQLLAPARISQLTGWLKRWVVLD